VSDEKTAVKTAVSPLSGGRIPLGAHPGNTGGKKGRSGRPPNWLRQFCDDLLASPKCRAAVRKILEDESHPAFATMWKAAGDRAHGKAENTVAHSGEVSIRVVREPRMLIVDN
jgi:hypothetical protein